MAQHPAAGQPEPVSRDPEPVAEPGTALVRTGPDGAAASQPGFRLQFGIQATLLLPQNQKYGLELDFAYGAGPAVVTFGPQQGQQPFSLGAMVAQLAKMLGISDIANIADLASSQPWKTIFSVEIAPQLTVQLTSQPAVQLVIDLFQNGTPGVHLPGTSMPSWLKIEPNFTVYSLLVGYDPKANGLDLKARVTFDEQPSALMARGGLAADQPGKTELVSFPFPMPAPDSSNLQVKYLGLGQRFGPKVDMQAADPIADLFDKLEKVFTTNDPATLLTTLASYYNPQADWFVGAHVLLRGWEVRAVFNDPLLYGLEVTCTVDTFQGLLLEILYQKLGDGLGVYYGALTLPTQYRTIQLGVVSLTLPSFKIWIYTNGDFKVSVGWPLGPNSIGIQVYIFTGGGGFYFAKLRSGDNPSSGGKALLAAGSQDVVSYNPILEFGLGAWFGLGRSINSGPFSASLSLTLQGTFQGILAWIAPPAPGPGKQPPAASLSRAPDYYWFAATVSLIGQLQGAVDLKIIKLSVFVQLSVTAGVALEKDYASQVLVSARVDVRASLKILFITISVGFQATITETFQISGGLQPPASLNGPNNPAFAGMNDWTARGLAHLEREVRAREPLRAALLRAPRPLPQQPTDKQRVALGFLLQPSVTYAGQAGTANAVASLVIDCPPSTDLPPAPRTDPTALERLLGRLGDWLLRTYSTDGHWDTVVTALGEGSAPPPANWATGVLGFLGDEIDFVITGIDLTGQSASTSMAFFPMISTLSLTYDTTTIDFSTKAQTPPDYDDAVTVYFAALALSSLDSGPVSATDGPTPLTGPPVADLILDDYLLTVARQLARENAAANPSTPQQIAANIGGLGSRYLLSGLRLPEPTSVPLQPPIDPTKLTISSGYQLTGQQFAVGTSVTSASATLQLGSKPARLPINISFAGGGSNATATMPVAKPPTPPAPTWSDGSTSADITIETIPAAHTQDRTVAARTRLPWQGPAGNKYLVPLPPAVLGQSASAPVRLTVTQDDGTAVPVSPALLIPVTVHLVNRTRNSDVSGSEANSPYAPYVYLVDGTDDETRDRIEAALLQPGALNQASVSVLYDAQHSGYQSDALGSYPVLLAKTNLSTTSQPGGVSTMLRLLAQSDLLGPTQAPLTDTSDFLQLLWEVSVVRSPGTYLHYRNAAGDGLPGGIFCPPGQQPVGGVPTGDTATLTLAVVFPAGTTIQAWHNALNADLAASYTGTLHLALADQAGTPLRDLSPSYPPGCVAFRGRWASDELLHASRAVELFDDDWVAHLYHLLQFRVSGEKPGTSPAFGDSLWSLGLTPSKDDTASPAANGSTQTYRQVVPVYRFLADQNADPYTAVGGTPQLTLRLLDVFGNVLDTDTYQAGFDVRYNDPLWSPAEWPGARIAYRFTSQSGAPVLNLNLQFDPDAVIRTGSALAAFVVAGKGDSATDDDKVGQQVQVALQQYALVTGQLADSNTKATVTSTVLPSLSYQTGLTAGLLQFAQAAVTELEKALPGGGGNPQKLAKTISVPIDPADLATATEDVLPLTVSLALSRPPGLVFKDVDGRVVPKSDVNLATLAADLDPPPTGTPRALARAQAQAEGGDPQSDVALAEFAKDFEGVFAGFDKNQGAARLAARSDSADLATPDTAFLWVIRWSRTAGVNVAFQAGQAAYFALAPLALNLENGAAQVPTYGTDPTQVSYASKTFSGIDLDAWAQSFLLAFDANLSPESATAIAAADPAGYDQIMLAKDVLAQCLAAGMVPVYVPGSPGTLAGDLTAARDHLEQAALGSLSAAYGIASVVQVPATVTTAGDDGPASMASRFFGGIQASGIADGPDSPQLSVSSAKLPLVPTSEQDPAFLTFSVSVSNASTVANIAVGLQWQARFAEHLTAGVAEYGYQPSEWLRVVLEQQNDPLDFNLGTLAVPIPQRRFPGIPVLGSQAATQATPGRQGQDPLAPYMRWNYAANLTMPELAAQDSLWLEVNYNLPVTSLMMFTAPEPTLFQALASFTTALPQLQPWLTGLAGGATSPDPVAVVEAYLAQVKLVARAWAREMNVPDPWAGESSLAAQAGPQPPVGQFVDSYQISFQDAWSEHQLVVYAKAQLVSGECDAAGLVWPVINGQSPQPGSVAAVCTPATAGCAAAPTPDPCWYRAVYDFQPPESGQPCPLALSWPQLDVLARQTAKLDCWVTRNSYLSGDIVKIPTNPAFVYQTPTVSFASPVLPSITVPPLGPLPAQASLAATLSQALAAIAQAGITAGGNRLIKVGLDYSFELTGGGGVRASNSILLADQVPLLPDGGSGTGVTLAQLCAELDGNARVWFDYYQPATTTAEVAVYLVLFAEVAGAQLPVLQVEQLRLSVPSGWWPPG